MRSLFLSCGLLAAVGFVPASAFAQSFGGAGGSSFGSSGFGTAGMSSGGMSSGGMSSGGMSSGGMSSGGMSSGGMGGMGSGMGGMGAGGMGGMGAGGLGAMGAGGRTGQQGMLGTNQNQAFLGRNAQQTQNGAMGLNGMNSNRGAQGRGNLNTMNSMNGMNNGGNSNANTHPIIRPRQRVAFDYPVPKAEFMQSNLQTHLAKVSLKKPGLTNVLLVANPGGEVVMRGAVRSESDSKLAENLLKLEPGVRSVRNELTFPPAVEAQ